jgi:hypothetical protein
MRSAKNNVPRGKVKNYKQFWNTKLQAIRTERNRLRKVTERAKTHQMHRTGEDKMPLLERKLSSKKELVSITS